jgi:hydrogenase nickel incorporation protein HypA/HybF
MHEFTLIQNIFTTILNVAADNQLKRITKVTLHVGRLRQVVPDFLQFAFATTAKNTIAEGATLEIEHIPITVLCQNMSKAIYRRRKHIYLSILPRH